MVFRCFISSGTYGNNYRRRAAIARFGLGAVPPEDAVYSNSMMLDAAGEYDIRFEKV